MLLLLQLLLLLLLLQWLLLWLLQAVNRRPKGDRGDVAAGDFGEGWRFHLVTLLQPLGGLLWLCLLYTSPSPRDGLLSRMPSSA